MVSRGVLCVTPFVHCVDILKLDARRLEPHEMKTYNFNRD